MIRTRLRRIKKMHAARRLLRLQTHREIHKIYCRDGTENAAIDRANSEDAVAYKPAIGISFTCLDHDNRRSKILKQSSTNNRKKWPIDKIDDKTENLCLDIIPFTISISVMYPKEEDKEETVPEYDPTEALNTVFVLDLPHKYQFGQLHPTSMFKLPQSLVDLLIDDSVTKLAFHAADIVPQFFYSMTATDTRFLDKTPEKCGYVDISKVSLVTHKSMSMLGVIIFICRSIMF